MEVTPTNFVIDVGPYPTDWVVRPLGEIGRWYSGGTPSMANIAYWSGEIPWVSPKDMKVSRLYDTKDHISAKAVADGARLLPKGAVLMVIRGMILAHSFPVARAEQPLAFNQDVKAVVTEEHIDSNFVLHWLIGNAQKLRGLTTESTHGTKRLPSETVFRVPFPQPTKVEQEAIAEALSDADALIESLEQLLAKKRQLKQGAMQELLTGKKRLPDFEIKPGYKQTEVGRIPEDWDVKPLGSFCEIVAGRDLVKADYSPTDDQNHQFPIYSNALTNKGLYGYSRSHQYEPDRITVTARGDIGHAAYRNTRFCAIGRLLVLCSKCACDLRFLTEFINNFVDFALESTGVPQLTAPQISKCAVALPPTKGEQTAIATILSDMDAEITALQAKLAKVRQLKQGMMQELLTGRIRLV